MYIRRIAENILRQVLDNGKVGIILGARQVGKTTLVQEGLKGKNALFLNFDVEIDKRRFQAAGSLTPPDAVRTLGSPEILVIDEAQRLPEAARVVKGWYDSQVPMRILLLGSSSLDLLDQAAESLAGRNRKLFLPPLLFSEALSSRSWMSESHPPQVLREQFAQPLRVFLLERMAFGSYPEVVAADDRGGLLRNLSSDYLWKDILQTGLVRNPDLIKRMLALLAHQVGAEVSVQELAAQLHMSRQTVEHYLDLLEQTFVIFRLPSFSTNPRKEISKGKKVYFWDTGIRNALLNTFAADELRPDLGALWENWAIAEVAKRNLLEGAPAQLFFWRSRAQSEVDLMVRRGDEIKAFEIKWRPGRAAGRAFREAYRVGVGTLDPTDPLAPGRVLEGEQQGEEQKEE